MTTFKRGDIVDITIKGVPVTSASSVIDWLGVAVHGLAVNVPFGAGIDAVTIEHSHTARQDGGS